VTMIEKSSVQNIRLRMNLSILMLQ